MENEHKKKPNEQQKTTWLESEISTMFANTFVSHCLGFSTSGENSIGEALCEEMAFIVVSTIEMLYSQMLNGTLMSVSRCFGKKNSNIIVIQKKPQPSCKSF